MGLRWSEVQILSPRPFFIACTDYKQWGAPIPGKKIAFSSMVVPLGFIMSRLDSMIRRLEAQRTCLESAIGRVATFPGPYLELGLGNGRTFDHLRQTAPDRDIFVFERKPAAHPDCTPDPEFLIEGDFTETLRPALELIKPKAVLAHCDIGTGIKVADEELAHQISRDLDALLAIGAVILSDQPFKKSNWRPLSLPANVDSGRYFIYAKTA